MVTLTKKPTITTPSGHTLIVAPGTENPLSADSWFKKLETWREQNKEHVSRISVEEFLEEKHADTDGGGFS